MRGLGAAAIVVCLVAGGSSARATILSLSAADFVRHRADMSCNGQDTTVVDRGVLRLVDNAVFYRSVLLTQGQSVCSLSLIYNDLNAQDTLTARLLRKAYTIGGNVDAGPAVLAVAASASGVPDTVRKATDTTVAGNPINNSNAFYYVDLSGATFNLNAVGVQLDVRPSCP